MTTLTRCALIYLAEIDLEERERKDERETLRKSERLEG
jgi:hypothetical protein